MDAGRTAQRPEAQLFIKIYKRRTRGILIKLDQPLPSRQRFKTVVFKNYIDDAFKIQDFLKSDSGLTDLDAAHHFHTTRPKISQIRAILNKLPDDFMRKMRLCQKQSVLKIFSGDTLMRISQLETMKQRQEAIDRLLSKNKALL